MKHATMLLLSLVLTWGSGCQNRNFTNTRDSHGQEYGVPSNSIDGYAKAHAISRQEAAKRMREQLVPPSDTAIDDASAQTTVGTQVRTNK